MALNPENPGPLLAAVTRLLAAEGASAEVAVLAAAEASIEETSSDNWNGGTYYYALKLDIPLGLFSRIRDQRSAISQNIRSFAELVLAPQQHAVLNEVRLSPALDEDPNWRDRARAWVDGTGVTNQGRVRSDNLASRECDGLLFRSQPEIELYKALKSRGVSFAPLPVFVRGGTTYRRIEPDFILLKDGIVMVVEVDGDTVHTETPAEAHARTTMLAHEGAFVERVKASECDSPARAEACADRLLSVLRQLKTAK